MATRVVCGCTVSIPATYFDGNGTDKWSQQQYGDEWDTARCSGIVESVFQGGQWCCVKWDIDGTVTRIPVSSLHIDKQVGILW